MNKKIDIKMVVSNFKINGELLGYHKFGSGHINKTYLVRTTKQVYILQRINDSIFKKPALLMKNIISVSDFLKKKGFPTLSYIKTKDGKYYDHNKFGYFRMYYFKELVVSFEEIVNLKIVEEMAKAFAKFHEYMLDYNVKKISVFMPDFHNTPKRFDNFMKAVKEDKANRKKLCKEEIRYLLSQKNKIDKIAKALNDGSVHNLVIHNDTKINNVLYNRNTFKFACVIDLDTLMPGSILYDYGDALRSLFTGDNEDSENLNLININFDVFKSFTKGYLSVMRNKMTETEIKLMSYSIYLMAVELSLRFLEDYLNGDTYFQTSFDNQNLFRARTQIKLAKLVRKNLNLLDLSVKKVLMWCD